MRSTRDKQMQRDRLGAREGLLRGEAAGDAAERAAADADVTFAPKQKAPALRPGLVLLR